MKKITKILLGLFVVLFVIIVAELTAYVFISNKPANMQLIQATNNTTIPPPGEAWKKESIDKTYRLMNKNIAMDPKVLETLIFYIKGILQSSTFKNTYKGKVIEIDHKGGKAYYDYYDYKIMIRLSKEDEPQLANRFFFSEDDLSKTTFIQKNNDQEKPILSTEIKIGDLIMIEDEIDALKQEPLANNKSGYLTKSWGINRIKTRVIKL